MLNIDNVRSPTWDFNATSVLIKIWVETLFFLSDRIRMQIHDIQSNHLHGFVHDCGAANWTTFIKGFRMGDKMMPWPRLMNTSSLIFGLWFLRYCRMGYTIQYYICWAGSNLACNHLHQSENVRKPIRWAEMGGGVSQPQYLVFCPNIHKNMFVVFLVCFSANSMNFVQALE